MNLCDFMLARLLRLVCLADCNSHTVTCPHRRANEGRPVLSQTKREFSDNDNFPLVRTLFPPRSDQGHKKLASRHHPDVGVAVQVVVLVGCRHTIALFDPQFNINADDVEYVLACTRRLVEH